MSLGKRLITTGKAACLTEKTDIFSDSTGRALYSFDNDASDESGEHDGNPTDIVFGISGYINFAAKFNGSSSTITLPDGLGDNGDRTRSLWVKIDELPSSGFDTILYIGNQTADEDYEALQINSSGNIELLERNDAAGTNDLLLTSSVTLNLNQWHHIAYVFDGANRKLYINNSTANGATGTKAGGTVDNRNFEGNLGSFRTLTPSYDGSIDQLRIFDQALTDTQINILYNEIACIHESTTDILNYPNGSTPTIYYKFDNTPEDETGSFDATETNIEYRFGKYGQSAVFNGSDSEIDTGISSLTSPFTISFWFNENVLNSGQILSNANSSSGDIIILTQIGGRIRVNVEGTSTQFFGSSNMLTPKNWYHLVVALGGGSYDVYIDGEKLDSATTSITAFNSGENYILGNRPAGGRNIDGRIDQVRIYDVKLDSDQVTELFNEKPEIDISNFKTVLYEGSGSTQYISNVGMDLETGGGLIWLKNRDTVDGFILVDNVRGIDESESKYIRSSNNLAELTSTNMPSSLEANGFFIQGGSASTNNLNQSYVAWTWKAGGDSVSNTNGDLTSQVSANTNAGFSIVKYTGESAIRSVGHGLISAPELIFVKSLDNAYDWRVFSSALGNTKYLELNTSDGQATDLNAWGSTDPDSQTFTIGNSDQTADSHDFIAYCWHSVNGYSKIGTYSGTGTTGNAITGLGFQPNWLMVKRIDADGGSWTIFDHRRVESNGNQSALFANLGTIESDFDVDFTSDGFTLNTFTANANASGTNNYLYMAFR